MEKLHFKVSINAPVTRVYDTMLGNNSKSTYEQWTSLFNPTSTYKGSWGKGSKILFLGVDEKGEQSFPPEKDNICISVPSSIAA